MTKSYSFSKEQINAANQKDLITFAQSQGYQLENGGRRAYHAKKSGGLYFFKNSNRYFHFSSNTHGGTIDFAMHFCGMSFREAVAHLLASDLLPKPASNFIKVRERGELILPDRSANNNKVIWYLNQIRGISPEILSVLIHERKLYQQAGTGNCVFVGYNQIGVAKYCSMRGSNPNSSFKQDREFSNKSYPFHITGYHDSTRVYVSESPIDAMSRATIELLHGGDWKAAHYISLGCLSDLALERFLTHHHITEIVFCLDNDANGYYSDGSPAPNWGQEAAEKLFKKHTQSDYEIFVEKPNKKDVNDDLLKLNNAINKGTDFTL